MHTETLDTVTNLAITAGELGRHDESEQLHRRALAMWEKALGLKHPNTLRSMANVASASWEQGRHGEAEALHRCALAGREEALGLEHPDTLSSAINLAIALQAKGKHSEAEGLHRQALAGQEKALGLKHPETLSSVTNVAIAVGEQGRHNEAEWLHRRALAGREEALGLKHRDTLNSVASLADVIGEQGRHKAAEVLHRRALAGREEALGLEHPDTLNSVTNLAITLQAQGRHSEAEVLHRRALEEQEKALGLEHPDTLSSMSNLAIEVGGQGSHKDGGMLDRRAVALGENPVGPASTGTKLGREVADRWRNCHWEYDVFISHAGEDKAFAHRLRDSFKDVGLEAFVDQTDLFGGDKADVRMMVAIGKAPVGLALMSNYFFQKKWPVQELKLIVGAATLLPVLHNITYEGAMMALEGSPQADIAHPDEWQRFVRTVKRTTAVRNPSTSLDEAPFVQLVIFSALKLFVSVVSLELAQHASNKAFALDFVRKLEKAAGHLSKSFDHLTAGQAREAKTWKAEMQPIAKDLVKRS